MEVEALDLSNKFLVSLTGKRKVAIARGGGLPFGISPDEALLLAAWLVAVAEPFAATTFSAVLEGVTESA